MRILPVRLNQNIKGVNKNGTVNLNTSKQNPVKLNQQNDVLDISFKGQKKDNSNYAKMLESLLITDINNRNVLFEADSDEMVDCAIALGNDAPITFQIAALSKDKNGQNVVHKMFLDIFKNYADEMKDFNISEIDEAENMQDIYDKCNFDFKSEKKMNTLSSILKDKSPETIEKALLTQDENGQTPLHLLNLYNMRPYVQMYDLGSAFRISTNVMASNKKSKNNPINNAYSDLIYAISDSLGDRAPMAFRKVLLIKDKDGNTPLSRISKEPLEAIIDVLGKSAPRVLEEATLIQNKDGLTPWDNANDGVTSIYVDTLSDRAHGVVKKAMHTKNKFKTTLLYSATLEQMKAYKKALKDDTKEEFKEWMTARDGFGYTPLKYITDDRLGFLIDVFGDDAPEIIKKSLLLKDDSGYNQLYEADEKAKEVYRKLFGDKYDKIAEKSVKVGLLHRILNRYL